jgi:hypothetical protein
VLLGIVAFAAIPRIDFNAGKTPLSADVVASDIAHTQLTAMNQNVSKCMIFTAASATYEYGAAYCPVTIVAPCVALATCTVGTGETRNLADLGANITIAAPVPAGGVLAFNSLGEPYGSAAWAAALTITVTDGTTPQNITVQKITGKVN